MSIKLSAWSIISTPPKDNPYTPPELWSLRLHGFVYGHLRFKDGSEITTSRIMGKRGNTVVTYSGSEYELGDVDPAYEKLYPDAYNRLFKVLSEA